MSQRWELDSTSSRGTFLITPYKPIFILPFRYTSNPNRQPVSRNADSSYVVSEPVDYNRTEVKFQVSFKVKIFQDMLWRHADLWVAYTQVSHWQIYNSKISRPFRETNYEPELILNFPLHFKLFGFDARMASVGFNHQSNGRSLPLSRSWNRIMFVFGLERKNWSIYARPWIRLSDSEDDNPDISDNLGRADLNVIYTHDGHVFSLIGSHNLSFGTAVKGNLTFSWSFPIKGNLKGYMQASHGYGETLIDYNHKQTTVGVGLSLVEWL
ncbi:phospholipase A [Flavobacterium silvaticum]|uniref:Phosphatidylcholine 1-acylhydrolase n=1 Tax=Flavobacterium silvaticum TaxID=1852020 RepID=A0A972FUU8_9FLAO|nr:phospholipase A [Flavobacterium silvaticum]NMH28958.1 phospholipase A [Flavobacterium silvaticum]